jgi:arrestin-related trafficking adapter 3/6
MPLDDLDESPTRRDIQQIPPIPSYSLFAPPVTSDTAYFPTAHGVNSNLVPGVSRHPSPSPAHNLEDSRHSLHAGLRGSYRSQYFLSTKKIKHNIFVPGRATTPASSRQENVIPEDDAVESGRDANSRTNLPILRVIPTAPNSTALPSSPSDPAYLSLVDSHSPTSPSTAGGRKRFRLSAVSNVIIDAVRSTSPRPGTNRFGQSLERDRNRNRERSVDSTSTRVRRGRTMERGGEESVNLNGLGVIEKDFKHVKEKGRGIIAMMLGEKERADSEGWKEFKKGLQHEDSFYRLIIGYFLLGTYTFPISFSIPGNAPPTMVCDCGSVFWRLKANVHRPGTFISKMTATREVITVACPISEDTEDTENIIVERHWDQQMQYLISVAGRTFHIGGTIPVTFTLLPLTKVNVYRLSVILEGKCAIYFHCI